MAEDVRILPDYEALSAGMADALVRIGKQAVAGHGRFLLALNGGGTPQGLFNLLGAAERRQMTMWRDTHVFWGDERCVPPDDPSSSYLQARQAFLDFVGIPGDNVHRIKGEHSPADAAADYADCLAAFGMAGFGWPVFDLVLLGIGEDGHTASLFPGQPVGGGSDAALAVTARYQDRPAQRVSLTPAVFNSSKRVFIMASGAAKSGIIAAVRRGAHDPIRFPVQHIRPEIMTWWLDAAAAAGL